MVYAWLKAETTPVIALKLDIMEEIVNTTFVHVKMEEYAKIYLVVTNVSVKTAGKETIVTRFPKTGAHCGQNNVDNKTEELRMIRILRNDQNYKNLRNLKIVQIILRLSKI